MKWIEKNEEYSEEFLCPCKGPDCFFHWCDLCIILCNCKGEGFCKRNFN
jgi:hypothetical protein